MTVENTRTVAELMQDAHQIKGGTPSFLAVLLKGEDRRSGGMNAEIQKVESNRELSYEGKQARKARIREVATHELLSEMKDRRESFDKLLDQAETQVRAMLTPQFKDLSESDRILYNAEITDLKTKVLLAPNQNATVEYLEKLVDLSSKNGETALEMQDYFSKQLAEIVGKGENLQQIKPLLANMSKKLTKASQVDNFDEIKAQLNSIDMMRNSSWAVGITETAILENLGQTAGQYVNTPSKYFEENAELVEGIETKIKNYQLYNADPFAQ
ncbi:hypothetical protein [Bacillus toyonensis]|uniref:hypothetical protein n=1 Tax=Bacillus toyonensis TaxID=155322 RepID=UPI0020D1F584|nr:hypothetical protein [Bacillus toyonensis]